MVRGDSGRIATKEQPQLDYILFLFKFYFYQFRKI